MTMQRCEALVKRGLTHLIPARDLPYVLSWMNDRTTADERSRSTCQYIFHQWDLLRTNKVPRQRPYNL